MTQSSKRGRLSPYGAMLAHFQRGRFSPTAPTESVRRDPAAIATVAQLAGSRGTSTPPMDNARRAENYRAQRGGLAPTLTARQRRRLRKNGSIERTRLIEPTVTTR